MDLTGLVSLMIAYYMGLLAFGFLLPMVLFEVGAISKIVAMVWSALAFLGHVILLVYAKYSEKRDQERICRKWKGEQK